MTSKLLSPVRGWEARRALRTARRRADAELLATLRPSPRLAWRATELVGAEHRLELGRSLTAVVHAADERLLPGASPLDRGAVRTCRSQLLELAAIVCDLDRSVAPRGILLLERLPLYGRSDPSLLRGEAGRAREALDGPGH